MTNTQAEQTKFCPRCERDLPLSEWASGGYCRECRNGYAQGYMAASRGAKKEIEELREHVRSLGELVEAQTQRISELRYIGLLEEAVSALARKVA